MVSNSQDFSLSGPRHLSEASNWNETHRRTLIAASLVQGVYVMERDRKLERQGVQALAPPWWVSFHFQLLSELRDISDSSIFRAIFELSSPIDTFAELHLPRYVIALRGTVIEKGTMLHDFKLNLQIFLKQNLEKCSRVEQTLKFARSLVDDVGPENVWLAGHSLGSAIALTVGRNMVNLGFHLDSTYLFNPPYISVPLEKIKNTTLKSGARMLACAAKGALSRIFMNHQQRAQAEETFIRLSCWAPYLFVNGDDLICSEYIGYFGNRQKMECFGAIGARMGKAATKYSSTSMAMCAVGLSAEPFHLLPTANLVINTSVNPDFREAHGVAQWWTESFNCQPQLYKY